MFNLTFMPGFTKVFGDTGNLKYLLTLANHHVLINFFFKVTTKAPLDCMCRPCTGVEESAVIPQEIAGYADEGPLSNHFLKSQTQWWRTEWETGKSAERRKGWRNQTLLCWYFAVLLIVSLFAWNLYYYLLL